MPYHYFDVNRDKQRLTHEQLPEWLIAKVIKRYGDRVVWNKLNTGFYQNYKSQSMLVDDLLVRYKRRKDLIYITEVIVF